MSGELGNIEGTWGPFSNDPKAQWSIIPEYPIHNGTLGLKGFAWSRMNEISIISLEKVTIFNCGFSVTMTCGFLAG